jgi:hypothetical protein
MCFLATDMQSSATTGEFAGAFFGPDAEEIGGTWTLTDQGATGGKTAVGINENGFLREPC